ncbi:hypothetical protein D3C80_821730 [compost metagenome]
MEQPFKLAGKRLAALRFGKGFFHLAEDLRFTQHQRIQPAGYAHKMADGVVAVVPVQAFAHFFRAQMVVFTQPGNQLFMNMFLLFHAKIKFSAVTGRQHDTALHQRLLEQAG